MDGIDKDYTPFLVAGEPDRLGGSWACTISFPEETMYKIAAALLLLSSPAFAEDREALKDCRPIGQTAKGELVYGLDCKGIKTDYTVGEHEPNMAPTNLKDTVIPKSGATQTPETTPTKGETR
jgi:hypothetical protein